jgi:creatinine amidohydrolase/Fe(II)-dependent formamide hydrolase-like protein
LSGHAGNFVLNPCVRDLNRAGPPGRAVVLVPEAAFFGPMLRSSSEALDLHAGQWETSVMLAIAPHLVLREALTNAPIKAFSSSGVWGRPRAASAEAGTGEAAAAVDRVATFISTWQSAHHA